MVIFLTSSIATGDGSSIKSGFDEKNLVAIKALHTRKTERRTRSGLYQRRYFFIAENNNKHRHYRNISEICNNLFSYRLAETQRNKYSICIY
jgi:hypothetical protein